MPTLALVGPRASRLWRRWRAIASGPRLEQTGRIAGNAAMVLAPIVLLSLIAVAIVYVRLLHGPVSLKAFSVRIEQGIGASLGSFRVDVDDAVVALAEGRGIELQLINLRVSEPDGDLVASAPLAAVELDHGALLMLRAVPERVFLIEPKLSLLYTDAGGLALSFADPPAADAGGHSAAPPAQSPQSAAGGSAALSGGATETVASKRSSTSAPYKIDLARALAQMTARARSGVDATSNLRGIGFRDAVLAVDYRGSTSEWKIAEATIDFEHKKRRSIISGAATIASAGGSWALTFRTEDSEKRDFVRVTTSVQDLVPSTLAHAAPEFGLLETLDMPIAGELALDLSGSGDLKGATLTLGIGSGRIGLPAVAETPLMVDAGTIRLAYDATSHVLKCEPSTLRWGDSNLTFQGAMRNETLPGGDAQLHFGFSATEGVLAAEEFGVSGVSVDSLVASGRLVPKEGLVELSEFTLKAGGAEIAISGEITTGRAVPSTRIEAVMSPMTLPTLKALWPRAVAPGARMWVGKHVTHGELHAGSMRILSGRFLGEEVSGSGRGRQHLSMTIEAGSLQMVPLPDGLPIEAPRALIRLENRELEVTVPEAAIIAGPSQRVPLKAGKFTVADVQTAAPVGELAFETQTSLAALLEAASKSRHVNIPVDDLPADAIEGKAAGQFKVTMPLAPSLDPSPPRVAGKARVTDIRTKQRIGALEIQGGSIDIDLSETGAVASGELLLNGVLAKLEFQRIFDVPDDMQSPLRLRATLDNADRVQLGLDINHLVQGDVPLEIALGRASGAERAVHARVDLTNTELAIRDLAWRKPPGRVAYLEFDVGAKQAGALVLKNFKISGDDIAVEGWVAVDETNEVNEYYFPNFSLNVVSRLEVQGKLGGNKVWNIKARGAVYDGRDLFRSLLALGRSNEAEIKPLRPSEGMDIEAEIDTVLGHADVSMRNFKLKFSERREKLTGLDAQGTLDGGKPLTVALKKDASGARVIYADTTDAGQASKLSGFYPNIQGGRARLELNLDGRGAADKSGVLWVESFRVLGDPVVSEVYSSVSGAGPAIDGTPKGGGRQVVREVFEFDRMKVPFSAGHGQFVLEESYVKGPIVGASIRGKVDYNAQRVNLGGTYVPLQGLSSAFCEIPLFGPIVAGPGCEGVFGITYAIQGPMKNPQVIVNPLSVFTPGIFRGIMEMTNPNPQVLPRDAGSKAAPERGVRSSSSSVSGATAGGQENGQPTRAGTLDGWSSDAGPPNKSKN